MTTTSPAASSNSNRSWSAQQLAIFAWFSTGLGENLVVRARAGTGKTTTILQGIGHAPEGKILLAAFNKRIATELKDKLQNPRAEAKTLHSVGMGFVTRNWGRGFEVDSGRGFDLALAAIGKAGSKEMFDKKLARLVANIASMGKNMAPFATVEQLQDIANEYDLTPDETQEEQGIDLEYCCAAAHRAMELASRPNLTPEGRPAPASIDFDDMIFIPIRNRWVKSTYDLVVIDEAQDMNAAQLLLAQGVCKQGGRIVVVGDDRQAIYGFRGADSGSIDRLKTELAARELGLNITYRCPKKVVAVAAELVPDYRAAATAPEGILRDIEVKDLGAEVQPNDFVLSRKNAPLVKLCLAVLRGGKRARIEGRDIGANIIAVVDKLKARDMVDLEKRLNTWATKQIKRLVTRLGEDKAEPKVQGVLDMKATIQALAEGLASVSELVNRIQTLFSDNGVNQVVFSSVHKAKGLEAERVFTIEESFAITNPRADRHEEANVRYVAVTRAKNELVFVKGAVL